MSAEPDWEDVRRDYEAGALSVLKLLTKYHISLSVLTKQRIDGGWIERASAAKGAGKMTAANATLPPAEPPAEVACSTPARRTAKPKPIAQRRALVARLTNAIDTKLKLLERRFEREMSSVDNARKTASAADFERDTRSIGLLIKNLEQVTNYEDGHELGKRITGAAAKSATLASTALADEADRIRTELAARLQRFVDTADASTSRTAASPRAEQAD